MLTITCPWCEQDEPLELGTFDEADASFVCADCGTSVTFVDETAVVLDIAA